VSTSEGGDEAAFELGLFGTDGRRLTVRMEKDSLVRIVHEKEGEEKVLAKDTLRNSFFGGPTLLDLRVHEGELVLSNRMQEVTRSELPKSLEGASGILSYSLRDVKGVFHRMTVRSIGEPSE
jgi:hypothetical protein